MDSFFKFLLGFLIFIGVSFGVTFGVSYYAKQQDAAVQQAAALKAMLAQ